MSTDRHITIGMEGEDWLEALQWSADPLDRLVDLRHARETIERMIEAAVVECRTKPQPPSDDVVDNARPISWAKIAERLGVSRQTAWQRFQVSALDAKLAAGEMTEAEWSMAVRHSYEPDWSDK